MDPKKIRVLSNSELQTLLGRTNNLPVAFKQDYYKELKTNLLTPSTYHNYSCCIEYMLRWFYTQFPDNFFKTKYLELQHIFHSRRTTKSRDLLVTTKPAVSIKPTIDQSFNRDNLDLYNYGQVMYNNRARYKDAFFIDNDRSLYISMQTELLKINFSFKLLFAEQPIQIDVARRCALVFRANGSQTHYNDVDFHIPDELLIQLAEDTNNCVCPCSGKICDAEKFTNYFNMHSGLPLYYKFDSSKHKIQYYLKIPRCYTHIKTGDIQMDEGQMRGNLNSSYGISFDCEVRFPAPKFYAYYSLRSRGNKICMSKLDEKSFGIMVSSLARVPYKNDRGWPWKMETEYHFDSEEEIDAIKNKELLTIHFEELLGDLKDSIESTKSMALNPDVFLELRVYSYFKSVPIRVDWWKYTIELLEPISSSTCYIILYMDGAYFANMLTVLNEYDKQRVQPSDSKIEHRRLEDYKKNLKRASMGRKEDKVNSKEEYQ